MNFLTKIKLLNQFISFNIFAIAGLYETFVIIYINKELEELQKMYPNNSSAGGLDWYFMSLTGWYICLLLISFVVYLFENIFKHKINNKFILNNKIYNTFIYISAFLSLIYFVYLMYVFIDTSIIQPLLPSDLIYYDIHAKQ